MARGNNRRAGRENQKILEMESELRAITERCKAAGLTGASMVDVDKALKLSAAIESMKKSLRESNDRASFRYRRRLSKEEANLRMR